MKKIKIFLIMALAMASAAVASAQRNTVQVSGSVTDTKGESIAGAVVMLSGNTSVAAVTDGKGAFVLSVPSALAGPSAKVDVSCIGFKQKSVALSAASKIILEEEAEQLEELIVVGYGSMRRSDLTGSVASVKIDESDAGQSRSLDQLLQGNAAGVQVINNSAAPDAGVNINIRGRTSLTGNSQPLYVVDGVILTSSEGASMLSVGDSGEDEEGNSLLGINPQDIASIEILKDASATAIYGSEGANGVVLITTKMADREKPRIRFSTGMDYMVQYKRFPVLSFDEYVEYLEANTFNTASLSQLRRMYSGYNGPDDRGTLAVNPVDWQDFSFRNTLRHRYFLSISGRPGTLSYNFSVGYNETPGIVRTTGLSQYTFRINVEKAIGKNLRIGTKINYAYSNSRAQQGTSAGGSLSTSMMRSILVSRPYLDADIDLYDEEDWEDGGEDTKSTPVQWMRDSYRLTEKYRFTPNAYLQWKMLPWLSLKISGGGDYNMQERTRWRGATVTHSTQGANVSVSDVEALRWNVDALLLFNKKIGRHSFSGTAGITASERYDYVENLVGYNINQYFLKAESMNSSPNAMFSYSESRRGMLSYLARGIYNYRDKYVLTGTFRVDGSSMFKGANKFAAFPSFAFAWRMNRESWFRVPFISTAKFRVGWGEVGNSGVAPYQTYVTYGRNRYPSHDPANDSGYVTAMTDSNLANETLKWETTRQWNAGLDLGLWQGRFTFSMDAYDKLTVDLLNSKKLPYSSGYTSVYVNQGSIRNRGLEFTVEAVPVKTKHFEWSVNGNLSMNRNKIIDIGTDSEGDGIFMTEDDYVHCNYYPGASLGSGRYFDSYANIFIEGQPMGLFYGYKTDGVIQEGETAPAFTEGSTRGAGYLKYKDLDKNGYISPEDKTILGDPNPDFTFGFGTSFTYRRWSAQVSFNGSYGNDICNTNLNVLMDTGYSTLRNVDKRIVEGAWTPEKPDAKYPQLGKYVPNTDSGKFTDLNVEDGSYIRLSSIRLSYWVPLKKSFIKRLDFGLTAGNVYVWTKYSGWDPEVSSYGSHSKKIGIDSGSYPGARRFCLDVKFSF